ncbi:hypothetical protein NJ56_15485 [Yersinia ruckeri]|nr:hypothetical protein NJ56_15485 [Yersinia ruckeri]PHZ18685.1 hypothetical protein CS534_14275 [Yersinia ruckeri]
MAFSTVSLFFYVQSLTIIRYEFRDLNHKNIKLTPFSRSAIRIKIIKFIKTTVCDVKTASNPQFINNKPSIIRK